jgi:ubiquitin-protein ligase E3 A
VSFTEYVDLYVRWYLKDSIAAQFEAFLSGFRLVCESRAFDVCVSQTQIQIQIQIANAFPNSITNSNQSIDRQMFRAEELEQLVCGSPVLDFEELEKVTQYDNGYHQDHRVIKYVLCRVCVVWCVSCGVFDSDRWRVVGCAGTFGRSCIR